ncbi:hypothetical protein [Ruegeria atlantica]|uniref:Uncharacterized protein n=1 Tax=Ruegeria atlantica TaxID=81569 RepID=A0A0P1F2I0_9RHOB|nr:hypothetical protein [Ruegeria atlantica]CUH49024.1 hypothetical protein RUA4292_03218 [Ruegeria atlantica]
MATITKRESGKWQAIVRKEGKSRSRTFSKRADACRWARETELQVERGEWQKPSEGAASTMTLGQVLGRYRDEVTMSSPI